MFQYVNKEEDYSRCSNESEEDDEGEIPVEELFKKPEKGKKGRKSQWTEHLADDLVDVILNNNKYKGKLLLSKLKNVKNGQYYHKVIVELIEGCSESGEEFSFNIAQTRQKFKRCINICKDAVMKVKVSSDIKRFQEDKELGSWFRKLLPIISSMDNCQAIELSRKAPETNGEEVILKKVRIMIIFAKKRQVKALLQGHLTGHQMEEGNMYLHQGVQKNLEDKLRVS